MTERRVSATQFKTRCLALMDEVARTGHALVITKRKQDLVRVVPSAAPASLRGSGSTSWIGTESAKIALFFSAFWKIGSCQSTRKLCSPTHCAGVIPSQRVKAW